MSVSIDLIALTLLPLGRWRRVAEQLQAGQFAAAILEQHCDEWSRRAHVRSPCPGTRALRTRAVAALERAARQGISCLPWNDPAFPAALATIADPPPVLWIRGAVSVFDPPSVAIVGSRAGSPYALAVAERLAADLCARGLVVISGLARGVDSAAHRGALSVSGRTIAVLGCGVDVVYPREHRADVRDRAERRCRERAGAGNAAEDAVFSAPQPDHQRAVQSRRRHRGGGEKRIVDHGALRAGSGA
jgi:DNA processing protein